MILYLHPDNPEQRKLKKISEELKKGAVYIFPTDTVYALISDPSSREGVEKLYNLKKMPKNKPLSYLCRDIAQASELVEHFPNTAYKTMKRLTPGPFVFILKANRNVSRFNLSSSKEKEIGIRIPDHIYLSELLKIHESALISTSVITEDEYITDIDSLEDLYGKKVSGIIDGGIVKVEMATILDFTNDDMVVVREGKGIELV